MKSISLKVLLVSIMLGSFALGAMPKSAPVPHIVSQRQTDDGKREIVFANPRRDTIWAYFECWNVMSVQPTRIPPGTHTVVIEAAEPIEPPPCLLHFWVAGENVP